MIGTGAPIGKKLPDDVADPNDNGLSAKDWPYSEHSKVGDRPTGHYLPDGVHEPHHNGPDPKERRSRTATEERAG